MQQAHASTDALPRFVATISPALLTWPLASAREQLLMAACTSPHVRWCSPVGFAALSEVVAAARAGAAVVVCSSEVEELVSLCARVLVIRNGYVTDELTGSRVNVTDINLSFHSGKVMQESGKAGS